MSCCQNCGISKGKLYREDIQHGLVFCGLECQQELIGSGEILDFADQHGPQLTWQLFLRRGSGVEGRSASNEKVVGYIAREFFNNRNEKIKTLLRWIISHPQYIPQMQIEYYDRKNSFLYVFLYYAIEEDSVDMVKFIVEELKFTLFANPNSKLYKIVLEKQSINVLHWFINTLRITDTPYYFREAVQKNLVKVVELLLQYEDPSSNNQFAIRYASEHGYVDMVKILLKDYRVDPSNDDNYAIRRASLNGHHEVVKLLLEDERVDPSAYNNEVIRLASANGHHEVVKLLLQDKRVDPSDLNNWAIHVASSYYRDNIVKLLLNHPRVQKKLTEDIFNQIKQRFQDDEEIQEILKLVSITKSREEKQEGAEPIIRRRRQLNNKILI